MTQQELATLRPAPKLSRENTRIDWNRPALEIYNLIRGLSPYPAAWTEIEDGERMPVKIYEAHLTRAHAGKPAGSIEAGRKNIRIAAADQWLEITSLQLPGKKRMTAVELLNGMAFSASAHAV